MQDGLFVGDGADYHSQAALAMTLQRIMDKRPDVSPLLASLIRLAWESGHDFAQSRRNAFERGLNGKAKA